MKTLLLSGMVLLTACGQQADKNYYNETHVIERDSENSSDRSTSETIEEQADERFIYGSGTEALTKANEFSFPVELIENKSTLPEVSSPQFFKVYQTRNKTLKALNYETFEKGTREVHIQGKHIIFNSEDKQNILALINNAPDLSKLTIEADIIDISVPLNLPQTHVVINAREVNFEGNGKIITTPKSLDYAAQMFKDGKNGLNGGTIEVYAKDVQVESGTIDGHLITTGGNGQQAGPGQDGSRGHKARIVKSPNYYDVKRESCYRPQDRIGESRHKLFLLLDKGRRSGNGKDAKVGGAPGLPGIAGDIILARTHDIVINQTNGAPGAQDKKRLGGAPGLPQTTCKLYERCRKKNRVYDCVTATKGKDVLPKEQKFSESRTKNEIITNKDWKTDAIIKYNLAYMEELYFRGFLEQAIVEKYKIESLFSGDKNLSPTQMLVQNKLQALEYQMAARLDFYGNPAGWTPNFNFSLNFRTFKNEVKRSLKILFYTELLQKKLEANQNIVNSTKSFQKELMKDVSDSERKLQELGKDIEKLVKSLADLGVARDEFEFELREIERKIKREARDNLKEPFLNKAVKIFAAASKVIPVGQPALALVGQGIEMVHNAANSKKPLKQLLKDVPNYMESLNGVKFKEAGQQLSGKLQKLSLTKLSEFSKAPSGETNEQRLERLKDDFGKKKKLVGEMIDFYKPIFNSVKSQTEMMRTREVSKSALDKEIAKIKRKHKMFKKVSRALEKLQVKQEETNVLLKKTNTQISLNFQKITENILLVSDLYTELGNASQIQSHKLGSLLNEYKQRAIKNLRYYHYKLAKSYSFKMLKPFEGELELEQIYEATLDLVRSGKEEVDAQDLDYAYLAYENELSKITDDVLSHIEGGTSASDIDKKFFLSRSEIAALNAGDEIYLDLTDSKFFGEDRENIRLENIQIIPVAEGSEGDLELIIERDRRSVISKAGKNFVFAHTDKNISGHKWITILNLPTGDISRSTESRENINTVEALIDAKIRISSLFVNPSARSFYRVRLKRINSQAELKQLEFNFNISYEYK